MVSISNSYQYIHEFSRLTLSDLNRLFRVYERQSKCKLPWASSGLFIRQVAQHVISKTRA